MQNKLSIRVTGLELTTPNWIKWILLSYFIEYNILQKMKANRIKVILENQGNALYESENGWWKEIYWLFYGSTETQ